LGDAREKKRNRDDRNQSEGAIQEKKGKFGGDFSSSAWEREGRGEDQLGPRTDKWVKREARPLSEKKKKSSTKGRPSPRTRFNEGEGPSLRGLSEKRFLRGGASGGKELRRQTEKRHRHHERGSKRRKPSRERKTTKGISMVLQNGTLLLRRPSDQQ